jgi:hypothetical protein
MIITIEILLRHSNFFDQEKYHRFDNLSYIEKIKKIKKYRFNNELAFKELQIAPFIEEASTTLKPISMHCKSLTFYYPRFINEDGSSYFIFPLFESFNNLNNLTLVKCEIPFTNFYNLLSKLENLEILNIKSICLVLTSSDDPNLAIFLQYPNSLKELTYINVHLITTDYPQLKPLNFVLRWSPRFDSQNLGLNPQLLPNLRILNVCESDLNTGQMSGFLAMNPDVESCVILPEQ